MAKSKKSLVLKFDENNMAFYTLVKNRMEICYIIVWY